MTDKTGYLLTLDLLHFVHSSILGNRRQCFNSRCFGLTVLISCTGRGLSPKSFGINFHDVAID